MLLHVDSVGIVKPFEHTITPGTTPDTNIRGTAFSNLLDTETKAMKKVALGVEDERFPGIDGLKQIVELILLN